MLRHRLPLILLIWVSCYTPLWAADYALLVAVEKYGRSTGLNSLQYSEEDADSLAALLVKNGYRTSNVVVLTQTRGLDDPDLLPTFKNIERELDLILGGLASTDRVVAFRSPVVARQEPMHD